MLRSKLDAEVVLGVLREVVAGRAGRRACRAAIPRRGPPGHRREARGSLERTMSVSMPIARLLIERAADEVLLEQRRRDAEHAGDVVEPVALIVGRQQLRGSISRSSRSRTALPYSVRFRRWTGLWPGSGERSARSSMRLLDRGREGVERCGVGPRHALRRHHAAAQLHRDLLPQVGVGGSVRRVQHRRATGRRSWRGRCDR